MKTFSQHMLNAVNLQQQNTYKKINRARNAMRHLILISWSEYIYK